MPFADPGLLALMPAAGLYGGLIALPVLGIAATSTTPSPVVQATGPLANYTFLLGRPVYLEAIARTLVLALVVAIVATTLAVPTALALRRLPRAALGPAIVLLTLPILVGPLVLALGWLALLSPGGPIISVVVALALPSPRLVGSEGGVAIALVYYGLPFAALVVLSGLLRLDPELEAAAVVDGASGRQVFRYLTLPLARSALAAGGLVVALLALSAYVTPQYLGGSTRPVLTMLVSQYVLGTFDRALASTAAMLLIALASALALLWPRPIAHEMDAQGAIRVGLRDRNIGWLPAVWLVTTCLFLLAPLGVVLVGSFSQGALFPGPPDGFSLRWYARVLAEPEVLAAVRLSGAVAAAATVLALLVAVPASARLARHGRWLAGPLTAPLAAPQLVLGLGTLGLLIALGLPPAPLGLVLAHAAFVTPVILRALLASLESLDPAIAEAATVDGAGPARAFVAVVLPQLHGGLLGGAALAFALSFTNVPLSLFLATPHAMPLPILMLARLETHLDPGLAALAVLLMGTAMAAGMLAWRAGSSRIWL